MFTLGHDDGCPMGVRDSASDEPMMRLAAEIRDPMGDSAIDQDDDPGADLVGEDEDSEQCLHRVSWNDPCERCELEEWDDG